MKKLLSTTIAAGIFASMSISPVFALADNALPVFNHGTNVDVTTNGNNMNIQIDPVNQAQYAVGTAYWDSFNIGSNASVNVEFTHHNQTSLNYVDAAGGMSEIYGKFTNSGCAGCDYAGSGKVVLINPNGVLFGNGADINLNSFTVSTMPGTYDQSTRTLSLTKGNNNSGIYVENGAKIYGDKSVALASDNVVLYQGSQISTNSLTNNVDSDTALGKVKIVTADGVNFKYYNNQAIDDVTDVQSSADKMTIHLQGDIEAGNIDVRNASTNSASDLNLNHANLKAVKAEKGSDGNIWLISNNRAIVDSSSLSTVEFVSAAERNGGDIYINASEKVSSKDSVLSSVGTVELVSDNNDVNVDNNIVVANKKIALDAGNIASVQNSSSLLSSDISIKGVERSQVVLGSDVTASAGDVTLEANNVWLDDATLEASNKINANAKAGYLNSDGVSSLNANNIALSAAGNVTGTYDLNNNATTINSGNDINITLQNAGNTSAGLVAEAENNVTISTDGTLSVSRLVSKKGDMTLTANKVVKGTPYNNFDATNNDEVKLAGDTEDRALISVRNGKFTSNVANDNYTITGSRTDNSYTDANGNTYNVTHSAKYGDEQILLVNPRLAGITPVAPAQTTQAATVNDGQAQMLNKMPRQPETYSNATQIADGRTTFVDVFAAASQIEIEDDEE